MSAVTLCPQCATRFKVSDEQLDAHDGMVRCGRCHNVFNAREHLQEEEPSPQLSLLIDEYLPADNEGSDESDSRCTPTETWHYPSVPSEDDATQISDDNKTQPDLTPIPDLTELEDRPATLAEQVQFVDDPVEEDTSAPGNRHRMATVLGISLLLLLSAQGAYYFRDTLAVKLPGLKPLLVDVCAQLGCSIELPREIELFSIESSELEADAKLANVITLHALLHNRSRSTQSWPSLELTLTDSRDDIIARRIFHPSEYLQDKAELDSGIGHNREKELALRLDTTDLRPSGYRLLLFYPLH